MSVVVRMEMPEGCWGCPFGHYDWIWGDDGREKMVCFCCLDGESEEDGHYLLETEEKRPSWCPIICSLPEGHGRLVDADKLADDMKARKAFFGRMSDPQCLVEDAPTIVPAEVERSETCYLWYRVEERLPDDSRDVIIFTASRIIGVGSFIRPNWYQWYSGGGLPVDVTYWMPLPEPPKEDA